MRGGDGEAHHKKSAQNGRYALASYRRPSPWGRLERGIPHDPAYLPGSHSPQLTCFPLANFFEILYNRIDMIVTGDWRLGDVRLLSSFSEQREIFVIRGQAIIVWNYQTENLLPTHLRVSPAFILRRSRQLHSSFEQSFQS